MRWWQTLSGLIIIIVSVLLFVGVSIASTTYLANIDVISSKEKLINNNAQGITLLDREGEEFFTFYNATDREYVPLSVISENVIDALIAGEDREFYNHSGVSIKGIVRSLLLNMESGSLSYGGSTITQQLVKNTILTPDKNLMRKYQELILARAIEEKYDKDEILEMYLNTAYFGEGAYGIENAASTYFGKSARDLNIAEATFIISLLPSPSAYSPFSGNIEPAKKRQKQILKAMADMEMITQSAANKAANQELTFTSAPSELNDFAIHYALAVRDILIEEYGEDYLKSSGMRVKTALSRTHQEEATRVLAENASRLAANGGSNGAVVVMEPATGEVLAMAGSIDWNNEEYGKYNMALAPRQPGSSFKPIVYALALEEGVISQTTILNDRPKTYKISDCYVNCEYRPKNYDNRFRGPVTVRRALANSLNVPAVQVMERVGVSTVLSKVHDVGIDSLSDNSSDYGLSLVLGAGNIPLLEMTNAYASFANRGEFVKAKFVLSITDKRGRTQKTHEERHRAWSSEVAFMISSILSDNNARREAFGNSLSISRPAAVKTGTTDDYRDSWTIGYTPDLVVGVWVGNNDNRPMNNLAGSLGAAPIWRTLMEYYHKDLAVKDFTPPDSLVLVESCYIGSGRSTSSAVLRNEYLSESARQRCHDSLPGSIARSGSQDNPEASDSANPIAGIDVPEGVGGPPEFLRVEADDEDSEEESGDEVGERDNDGRVNGNNGNGNGRGNGRRD